jgi:hypothetical protein
MCNSVGKNQNSDFRYGNVWEAKKRLFGGTPKMAKKGPKMAKIRTPGQDPKNDHFFKKIKKFIL